MLGTNIVRRGHCSVYTLQILRLSVVLYYINEKVQTVTLFFRTYYSLSQVSRREQYSTRQVGLVCLLVRVVVTFGI